MITLKTEMIKKKEKGKFDLRTIIVPSMWFWSVSWSTNCPVYFSFFLVDQKKGEID